MRSKYKAEIPSQLIEMGFLDIRIRYELSD